MPDADSPHACPFIDDDDPQCGSHFTLGHLSQAFGDCFGSYRRCPNYYRLLRKHPERLILPTVHGRPLQPTGT